MYDNAITAHPPACRSHRTGATAADTLSLHDALPICSFQPLTPDTRPNPPILTTFFLTSATQCAGRDVIWRSERKDRKSTRLNSSNGYMSSAAFCSTKKLALATQFFTSSTGMSDIVGA